MSFVRRELAGTRDLLALAAALPRRYPCLLESAAQGGTQARFDILFAFPGQALTLDGDGRVRDAHGADRGASFLDVLDEKWRAEFEHVSLDGAEPGRHPASSSIAARDAIQDLPFAQQLAPFRGGWLLFLGYELATEIEPHVERAGKTPLPIALALRCPAAIIVDRVKGTTSIIAESECADCLDAMEADLHDDSQFVTTALPHAQLDEDEPQQFLDGVARIHEYLRAGDVFQVNLSREWRARFAAPIMPAAVYAQLRKANPAPFAALLQWRDPEEQDWAIASSSPERLVEVRGEHVQTRPIAGTRPRMSGDDDALRIRELVGHAKERAEHIMLIDLERNDLGRVCVPGSVVVDELMAVESYAHVHHIVSNVSGRLRVGVTPAQVIRAVFPGGTITGAPKVRTMQIIAELEGCARGAYTGALGYLNRDGDMDLNILIRTMTIRDDRLSFRAGAGIVVDSDARHELEETRAKARGLLRALGA